MGILLAFFASLFSTAKDIVSKRVAFHVDGTTSSFASFLFAIPFYLIALLLMWGLGYEPFQIASGFFILVIFRTLTDVCAETLKMHSFTHGDLSFVSCFFALSPVMLVLISPFITGDPFDLFDGGAVLLSVLGTLVLFIPRGGSVLKGPVFSKGSKKALLLALGAAFFFALNSCFDRLAAQKATPVVSAFAMTFGACLVLAPIALRKGAIPTLREYQGAFLLRGAFEFGFMTLKIAALQYLPAPVVVGIFRVSLLFSIVGGRVFFKEEDFSRRLLAGLLISSGTVALAIRHLF